MRSEGFYFNEKSTDTSWDRTSDLPICSTVPAQDISRALNSGGTDMSGVRSTHKVDEKYHITLIFTSERKKRVGIS